MKINSLLPKGINKIIAKKQRNKLRVVIRCHKKLKAQGRLFLIAKLKDTLSDEKFKRINKKSSKTLFGASSVNPSLVVSQYLYKSLLVTTRFNKAILYSIGSGNPIRYPLPLEWIEALEKEGYRVDRLSCKIQWISILFVYFCFGIYRALGLLKSTIIIRIRPANELVSPAAYFNNLTYDNVQLPLDHKDVKNILTWYAQWNGRNKKIKNLQHNVKNFNETKFDDFSVSYVPITQLNMGSLKALFVFLNWLIKALLICVKDIMLFRWWTFLLFEQFVQAAILRYSTQNMVAADYLLHHNEVFYRPIWTYEVEKRNARVILYFYSTNNTQSFKNINGYPDVGNILKLSTWPLVLVWDKYQEQYVKRLFHSYGVIEIVGQIWFSSNPVINIDMDFKKKIVVGVFDVHPHRTSWFCSMGGPDDYYDSKVAIQFLKDIKKVLGEYSLVSLHKRKRNNPYLHKKYKLFLRTFYSENNISINPDLSAYSLIEKVDLVISMPFTSTGIIANYQNKPSIYYDPFGDIQKDDIAAHGIPVVNGIKELQLWVQSYIKQNNKLEDNTL